MVLANFKGVSIMAAQEIYINIDKVAELKGLKSNRFLNTLLM